MFKHILNFQIDFFFLQNIKNSFQKLFSKVIFQNKKSGKHFWQLKTVIFYFFKNIKYVFKLFSTIYTCLKVVLKNNYANI